MAGAIVIVVVLLLIPVLVLLSGGLAAAVLGEVLESDAEDRDGVTGGAELLDD